MANWYNFYGKTVLQRKRNLSSDQPIQLNNFNFHLLHTLEKEMTGLSKILMLIKVINVMKYPELNFRKQNVVNAVIQNHTLNNL